MLSFEASRPNIEGFFHRPSSTWSYVVSDPGTRRAAVVDAVLDYDPSSARSDARSLQPLVDYIARNALALDWILETHAHADHLSGAQELKRLLGGKLAIGGGIQRVQRTFNGIFNLGAESAAGPRDFDRLLEDGDLLPLGDLHILILATPGHTSDSVTFLIGDTAEEQFVTLRQRRDATLPVPALLLPAVQVNIRGGRLPAPEANGVSYLKIPLNRLAQPVTQGRVAPEEHA